jgi:hypothetical protein
MRSYLKEKQRLRSRKLRLKTVGDPPRWPRDTPLSAKVRTKFRQQVAVALSIVRLWTAGRGVSAVVVVISLPVMVVSHKSEVYDPHGSQCSNECAQNRAQNAAPCGQVLGLSSCVHINTRHPKVFTCTYKEIVSRGSHTSENTDQQE